MSRGEYDNDEGEEPLEEVHAEGCGTKPASAQIRAGERDGKAHEAQYRPMDEIDDQYVPQTIRMAMSEVDGLPVPVGDDTQFAFAPAFTPDNVICIEDTSSYVEVFEEDLRPEERVFIERMNAPRHRTIRRTAFFGSVIAILVWACVPAGGATTVYAALLTTGMVLAGLWEAHRRSRLVGARSRYDANAGVHSGDGAFKFDSDRAYSIDGVWLARVDASRDPTAPQASKPVPVPFQRVVVRPVRERCKHYKRQMFSNDDQPDVNTPGHYIVFRNCTVRRSVGGAFMSVSNEAVYGCDYRDPPCPGSSSRIDKADENILRQGAERQMVPLFNLRVLRPEEATGEPILPPEPPKEPHP